MPQVLWIVFFVALLSGGSARAVELSSCQAPERLVARAFGNLYGFTSIQRIEIRAGVNGGQEYIRTAQVTRRGTRDELNQQNRMLVRLLGPGELRGLSILLLEKPDFAYDAFMYQPLHGRVRRISVAQRGDAFFGTDVAFEDLEGKRAEQWVTRFLRGEKLQGRPVCVIELRPAGLPSSYERIVGWFDREAPLMLRAEFYRGASIVKTLEVDLGRAEWISGYLVPRRLRFRSSAGTVTTVDIKDIQLVDDLPERMFSTSALEFRDERSDAAQVREAAGATPAD